MGSLMRNFGVPQSPDEARRMASGFWTHEYRIENDETIWRCDLHKLDEAVRRIMLNPHEAMDFARDPKRYLDMRFGEGTGYCYSHSRDHGLDRPYLDYRFPRWMDQDKARYYKGIDWARDDKVDAMAYLYDTGTTTNTTTSTSGNTFWIDNTKFVKNHLDGEIKRSIKKKSESISFKKRRVKTMPFKQPTYNNLLETLQMEFDHWAGKQAKLLFN